MAAIAQNNLKQYYPTPYHSIKATKANKGYKITLYNARRARKITRECDETRIYEG
jgi:hypothetical protein